MDNACREKPALRLVKSSPRAGATATQRHCFVFPKATPFQRIETYARQSRRRDDPNITISRRDEALRETRALHQDDSARLARKEVELAEDRIDALKKEMEVLRGLIHIDHLTGALNRSGLDQAFIREVAYADRHDTSLCVALIDIDNFKAFNDSQAQTGDAVLAHLAQVIRKSLRQRCRRALRRRIPDPVAPLGPGTVGKSFVATAGHARKAPVLAQRKLLPLPSARA